MNLDFPSRYDSVRTTEFLSANSVASNHPDCSFEFEALMKLHDLIFSVYEMSFCRGRAMPRYVNQIMRLT